MPMTCDRHCVHCNYDPSVGMGDCELGLDLENGCDGEYCPEFYDRESARNDWILSHAPDGSN